MNIKIKDIVKSNFATDGGKGEELQKIITENLNNNVVLDFEGIELVNSAFLRRAIGELYKNKNLIDKLQKNITILNLDEDDLEILNSRIIPLYLNYEEIEKKQKEFLDDIQD